MAFRVAREKKPGRIWPSTALISIPPGSLSTTHSRLTIPDELHDDQEKPLYYAGGHCYRSHLFVVFMVRARDVIRLISARGSNSTRKGQFWRKLNKKQKKTKLPSSRAKKRRRHRSDRYAGGSGLVQGRNRPNSTGRRRNRSPFASTTRRH